MKDLIVAPFKTFYAYPNFGEVARSRGQRRLALAIQIRDDDIYVAYACCSPKDTFTRERARAITTGRLLVGSKYTFTVPRHAAAARVAGTDFMGKIDYKVIMKHLFDYVQTKELPAPTWLQRLVTRKHIQAINP